MMLNTRQQRLHRIIQSCCHWVKLWLSFCFSWYRFHQIYITWTTLSWRLQGAFVSLLFHLRKIIFSFTEVLTLTVAGMEYWLNCTIWLLHTKTRSQRYPKAVCVWCSCSSCTKPYATDSKKKNPSSGGHQVRRLPTLPFLSHTYAERRKKKQSRQKKGQEKKKTRTDGGLQGTYIYCHSEQVLHGHALKPFISAKFYHKGRSH